MSCTAFYDELISAVSGGNNEKIKKTLRTHHDCHARVKALHVAVELSIWAQTDEVDREAALERMTKARESVFILLHSGMSLASRSSEGDAAMRFVCGFWPRPYKLIAMRFSSVDDNLHYYIGGLEEALIECAAVSEIAEMINIMRERGCDEDSIIHTALGWDDGVYALDLLGYDFDNVDGQGLIALHHLLLRRSDGYVLHFVARRTRNKRPTDSKGRCLAHYIFGRSHRWGAINNSENYYFWLGEMGFIEDYCNTNLMFRRAKARSYWAQRQILRFD